MLAQRSGHEGRLQTAHGLAKEEAGSFLAIAELPVFLIIHLIEFDQVLHATLKTFNPSLSAFTLSESPLVYTAELVAVVRKQFCEESLVLQATSVPVDIKNNSFALHADLDWVSVVCDFDTVAEGGSEFYTRVAHGPGEIFVVYEFILVLPFLIAHYVTLVVLNLIILNFPRHFLEHNSFPSIYLISNGVLAGNIDFLELGQVVADLGDGAVWFLLDLQFEYLFEIFETTNWI